MGCCTLRRVIMFGITLAVVDILHGLGTLAFYLYQFIMDSFYLCPIGLPLERCHNSIYIYDQMFKTRTLFGFGEGAACVIFAIIYIVALVKKKPSLTWVWLLKSFAVVGLNIYYLASWLIRQGRYDHIDWGKESFEDEFIWAAKVLTLLQIIIMVLFCLLGAIFTYKIVEERTASRRSLRSLKQKKWGSEDATAPPLDHYDPEEAEYLNDALTNSEKTLPVRASKSSLSEISRADTFKHSTGV